MIHIYHNPRCKKSREGLAIVEASGEAFEVIRYLENPPTISELKSIISKLGIEAVDLVRKNEAIWKSDYKDKTLSEDDILHALAQHPKLIERPIVIKDDRAVIGRPPENIGLIL